MKHTKLQSEVIRLARQKLTTNEELLLLIIFSKMNNGEIVKSENGLDYVQLKGKYQNLINDTAENLMNTTVQFKQKYHGFDDIRILTSKFYNSKTCYVGLNRDLKPNLNRQQQVDIDKMLKCDNQSIYRTRPFIKSDCSVNEIEEFQKYLLALLFQEDMK